MGLRRWFRRRPSMGDIREEIESYVAMRAESDGIGPTEARRRFGNVFRTGEDVRRIWVAEFWDTLAQDARYALRTMSRKPVFAVVAVLSLVLAIGANTAIFSLVNAVLLQALPVSEPDDLVLLTSFDYRNSRIGNFAYPDYERLRDRTQVFSDLLAASAANQSDVRVGDGTERADVQIVSNNYFSVLGVRPVRGRGLTTEDDDSRVAIISYSFWRRHFGEASPIGEALAVNGETGLIVGVAPPEFVGESVGQETDIWVSVGMLPAVRPGPVDVRNVRFVSWVYLMGRLKAGMTIDDAHAESSVLVSGIQEEFRTDPNDDYLDHIAMEPGSRGSAGFRNAVSAPLLVSMAVVALVLLIACTNLASLLLARAASRGREIATRLALGAGRTRLIRQLLTESVLLAGIGGAFGLIFAAWSSRFLVIMLSGIAPRPITLDVVPDARVLLFTAVLSLFTGILFGLAPALQALCRNAAPTFADHSGARAPAPRRWALKNGLMTVQIALSLALLGASGLFVRTVQNLRDVDPGFTADGVLLVEIGRHRSEQESLLASRLVDRIRAIPGIAAASVAVNGPLGSEGSGVNGLEIDGYTHENDEDRRARADWVGPEYFETLGIPIVEGREFSVADTANSAGVVIVNQMMARYYFQDRSPVGRYLRFNDREYEIVGVASDSAYLDVRAPTPRVVYFAFPQNPFVVSTVAVRAEGNPLMLAEAVQDAIREVDPQLGVVGMETLSARVDRKLTPESLVADISGFFGVLSLLLVSIGIYGTLAYAVAHRTHEVGIRMALGARPGSIFEMILREIVWALGGGVALGVLAFLAIGPLVESLLFEIPPSDPATIGTAALLLTAVALFAAYLPARRASRVDPLVALRHE